MIKQLIWPVSSGTGAISMQLKSTSEIGNNVRWIIVDEGMLISTGGKKRGGKNRKEKKKKKGKTCIPRLTTRRTGDHRMKYTPRNDIISLIIIIRCRAMIYAPFLLLHDRAKLRGRNVTLKDESRGAR